MQLRPVLVDLEELLTFLKIQRHSGLLLVAMIKLSRFGMWRMFKKVFDFILVKNLNLLTIIGSNYNDVVHPSK